MGMRRARPAKWPPFLGRQKMTREKSHTIFEIITTDHKQFLDTLQKLMGTTQRAHKGREDEFTSLRESLLAHMHAEERLFYPFIMEEAGARQEVYEAIEEHHAAQMVMSEVQSTDAEDESWSAKVKVLNEMLEHHIEEEEDVLFEKAREVMDDERARELGSEYEAIKQEENVGRV
jgi:iron-sulfur cluster repair protein YtfE (RIC family)